MKGDQPKEGNPMSRTKHIAELKALKSQLVSEGFEYVCAISDDCGTGGIFFSKPPLTNDEFLYGLRERAVIRNYEVIYETLPAREVRV